jgi:NAD(P)-dependent dehydrogenase (short-subunit alcohol dehydrogenase family)
MEQMDVAIVGGGVVGLATALAVAERGLSVCVLERHPRAGLETSTHNSGVIHGGIYYPAGTLKAALCVEGQRLLYAFCAEHRVPHERCGKLIVAHDASELDELNALLSRGVANGVEGLELVDRVFITRREPAVRAVAAIFSPETGIVDAEALVRALLRAAQARDAIFLAGTLDTPMKRYDLMHAVNVRGTFLVSQACLPHLLKSTNPHILNIAPPLNMRAKWFGRHLAYTMSKYGMSQCVLGMAEEFRTQGVAVNALWPATVIATAAVQNLLGGDAVVRRSRKPEIMAEAAHAILVRDSRTCTGNFFTDEEMLRSIGMTDLQHYAVDPSAELLPDIFTRDFPADS